MLDLINGLVCLIRDLLESHPNQHCTPDVIANNPCQATLTPFKTGQLLGFTVKLLNLPPPVTRLLCNRCVVLKVVGYNIIREPVTGRNPEKFHLVMLGKASDFNPFPASAFTLGPLQAIYTLVRLLGIGVIYLTIRLQRAIVVCLTGCISIKSLAAYQLSINTVENKRLVITEWDNISLT